MGMRAEGRFGSLRAEVQGGVSFSKRLGLRHSYRILRAARHLTVRSAPKVKIGCENASKSSDDGGAFPWHLHFVKRLTASAQTIDHSYLIRQLFGPGKSNDTSSVKWTFFAITLPSSSFNFLITSIKNQGTVLYCTTLRCHSHQRRRKSKASQRPRSLIDSWSGGMNAIWGPKLVPENAFLSCRDELKKTLPCAGWNVSINESHSSSRTAMDMSKVSCIVSI